MGAGVKNDSCAYAQLILSQANMNKHDTYKNGIVGDCISDVVEHQARLLIRITRGMGRDAAVAKVINRLYEYTASLELELIERDVLISELLKHNKKMFELPAVDTVLKIRELQT